MTKKAENLNNAETPSLNITDVSKRKFYLLNYGMYGSGYDGDIESHKAIFWGTWIEAAREVVKYDQSITKGEKRCYRRITEFILPNVSRKRRPFYVC